MELTNEELKKLTSAFDNYIKQEYHNIEFDPVVLEKYFQLFVAGFQYAYQVLKSSV